MPWFRRTALEEYQVPPLTACIIIHLSAKKVCSFVYDCLICYEILLHVMYIQRRTFLYSQNMLKIKKEKLIGNAVIGTWDRNRSLDGTKGSDGSAVGSHQGQDVPAPVLGSEPFLPPGPTW